MNSNRLLRYRPHSPTELITPFDSLLNELFNDNFSGLSKAFGQDFFVKGSYPKVNVINADDEIVIEAAIPGLSKKDISIELKNDILTISGNSNHNSNYSDDTFVRRELKKSRFQRSFAISENVDKENIKAACKDGVLTLKLPKLSPEDKRDNSMFINIE